MKTILLFLITVVLFLNASCETHHDQEKIVKDLIVNHNRIKETMNQYKSTKFYLDSVLISANPDTIWSNIFSKFSDNYSVTYNGIWIDKWYYEKYDDVDGSKSNCISIINLSNKGETLEFHFKKRYNNWYLFSINYVPQLDIE